MLVKKIVHNLRYFIRVCTPLFKILATGLLLSTRIFQGWANFLSRVLFTVPRKGMSKSKTLCHINPLNISISSELKKGHKLDPCSNSTKRRRKIKIY